MRRGYSDTLLLLRLIGVYNLLCDNCNLLFRGLAVPGTVPPRHGHRRHRRRGRAGHDGGPEG